MADIIHRLGIKAPVQKVYQALSTASGVAGWWSSDATGESEVGKTMTFRFNSPNGEEIGRFEMDVLELSPNQAVRWRVKSGPEEWVGTDIDFALSQQDEHAIVLFGHRNWPEAEEFMAHCSMKWATFLLSLRNLVETGQGNPSPFDLKIDNWN